MGACSRAQVGKGAPHDSPEAATSGPGTLVRSFRALVHTVTVHPNGPREGFQLEVKGKLTALIGGDAFPQAVYSGGRLVAEARYHRSPRSDWPLFTLQLEAAA